MCRDEGMAICIWGALGQGKFQTAASFAERERNNPGRKMLPPNAHDKAVSAVLELVAERKGTSLTNVALAYPLAKAPYVFPIVGCRKVEYLKKNIEALTVSLNEEDIKGIEKGYEFDPGFPHTFLSGTTHTGEPPRGAYKPEDNWVMAFNGTFDWVEAPKPIQPVVV